MTWRIAGRHAIGVKPRLVAPQRHMAGLPVGDGGWRSPTRCAIRNSGSPKKLPAMSLTTWSFFDGGVFPPMISHQALPAKVSADAGR